MVRTVRTCSLIDRHAPLTPASMAPWVIAVAVRGNEGASRGVIRDILGGGFRVGRTVGRKLSHVSITLMSSERNDKTMEAHLRAHTHFLR